MKSSKGVEYEGFDRIYHVVPTFSWLVVTKKNRQLFLFGRAAGNNLSTYYLDRCCVTGFCRVCDLNLCSCSVAAVSGTTT